jgi:hypothetical protein
VRLQGVVALSGRLWTLHTMPVLIINTVAMSSEVQTQRRTTVFGKTRRS